MGLGHGPGARACASRCTSQASPPGCGRASCRPRALKRATRDAIFLRRPQIGHLHLVEPPPPPGNAPEARTNLFANGAATSRCTRSSPVNP